MMDFASALYLWRRERGLSQAALAAAAGLPRPNLSDLERGRRDLTLTTLRALAAALKISPGTLADGVPPRAQAAPDLSRAALERVAEGAATGRAPHDPAEREAARSLRLLLQSRRDAARHRHPRRSGARAAHEAWIRLRARYGADAVKSLIDRAAEKTT